VDEERPRRHVARLRRGGIRDHEAREEQEEHRGHGDGEKVGWDPKRLHAYETAGAAPIFQPLQPNLS
jgi:hypothetical protein